MKFRMTVMGRNVGCASVSTVETGFCRGAEGVPQSPRREKMAAQKVPRAAKFAVLDEKWYNIGRFSESKGVRLK
jgi:hypothetical protein